MNHAKPVEGCPPAEAVKAYVDGELPAPERELVAAHLTACAACESDTEALRQLNADIRKLGGALEPPAELRGRILSGLTFQPEQPVRPPRRLSLFDFARWGAIAATAAVLVTIAGGLVLPLTQQAREAARQPSEEMAAHQKAASQPGDAPGGEMAKANKRQYPDFMRSAAPASERPAGGGGGGAAGEGMARGGHPGAQYAGGAPGFFNLTDGHNKLAGRLENGRVNGDVYAADDYQTRSASRAKVPIVGVRKYAQDYDEALPGTTVIPGAVTGEDVKKYTRGKEADEVRRKVVQNGTLSVRIGRRLETVQDEVAQRVKKEGGYVEASDLTAPEKGERTSTMTLRVPVEKFEATVAWLCGLGEVQAKNLSGQDVTATWIDQRAEVRKLRDREDKLSQKIRTAKKQSERDEARWALQALRPQIAQSEERFAYTGKLAALASITLTLTEEPQARVRGNLLHDLDGTTRAAAAAFMVAIRVPAAILIWLAIFSPLWLPCVLVYRWATRMQRRSVMVGGRGDGEG